MRVSRTWKLLKEMFSWKTTLLPIIILSVASFYFPQVGFTVSWFFNQGKEASLRLQKAAHALADLICNKPEECKQGFDKFFEFLHNIPQDVLDTYVLQNVTTSPKVQTSSQDDELARKQLEILRNAAIYNKDEVSSTGDPINEENALKSLQFLSYNEKNLCDLKEGIPEDEFDATVENIANLANLPEDMKNNVKRARNLTRRNVVAVNRLEFEKKDGTLVFGRVIVLRMGNTLDMAYSLHSVKYKLKNEQSDPELAGNFTKFSGTVNKANDVDSKGDEDDHTVDIPLRNNFLAFFHRKAVEGFVKHCGFLLNTLDSGQKEEAEIIKLMTVSDDEKLERILAKNSKVITPSNSLFAVSTSVRS